MCHCWDMTGNLLVRTADEHARRAALLDAILANGPMPVPEPEELSRELQELHGARFPVP